MIRGRTIICVASDFEADPTSKHHVMRLLARHNHILWVTFNGSRTPGASATDVKLAFAAIRRIVRGTKRISDTMLQCTPCVIPGAYGGPATWLNQKMIVSKIKRDLRRFQLHDRPTQLWLFTPDVAFLAGCFNEERTVYYCVDEYSEFAGYDANAIRTAEKCLLEKADIVLTTSQALCEAKSRQHPNVHLVRHGVDFDHFAQALDPCIEYPEHIADLARPVAGFFGLIHHWVDIDLLASVARQLPQMHFVLLGRVISDVQPLRRLPNVILCGRKPYADLPAYCAKFDLALLPFACNELTRNVNPVKLREYFAAGLPVVSTPLPEVTRYKPDVYVANSVHSFAAACLEAARQSSRQQRISRAQRVKGETWQAVVDQIGSLVMEPIIARRAKMGALEQGDRRTVEKTETCVAR